MEEQIDLILLTGAYRLDNLRFLMENVEYVSVKYAERFNIFWLICIDQYNSRGNIEVIKKKLTKKNIRYSIKYTGKPNQPNYGGDLYNEPLKEVLDTDYKDKNPWIYILDDDNLFNDDSLLWLSCVNDRTDKEIIWFPYMMCNGEKVAPYSSIALCTYIDNNSDIRFINNPDPSCVIFKARIIKDLGYLKGRGDYDYTSMREMISKNFDKTLFISDHDCGGTYLTHNGLVPLDDFTKAKQIIEEDKCGVDVIFHDVEGNPVFEEGKNSCRSIRTFSRSAKRQILNIVKEDWKNFGYLKDE